MNLGFEILGLCNLLCKMFRIQCVGRSGRPVERIRWLIVSFYTSGSQPLSIFTPLANFQELYYPLKFSTNWHYLKKNPNLAIYVCRKFNTTLFTHKTHICIFSENS